MQFHNQSKLVAAEEIKFYGLIDFHEREQGYHQSVGYYILYQDNKSAISVWKRTMRIQRISRFDIITWRRSYAKGDLVTVS
jgi:hypothetical protein